MIDLKLATESWDEREYQAIERVVKSGEMLLSMSPGTSYGRT